MWDISASIGDVGSGQMRDRAHCGAVSLLAVMAGCGKRWAAASEHELDRYAGRMQQQRRFAGAPLELAAVILTIPQVTAEPLLEHFTRQPEIRPRVHDICRRRRRHYARCHGGTGCGIDDEEAPRPRNGREDIDSDRSCERNGGQRNIVNGGGFRRLSDQRFEVQQRL